MGNVPIALQIWTVREAAKQDFVGTLRRIAEIGFAGVEHVFSLGWGGMKAAEVRALMQDLGMETAGCHIELKEWEADLEGVLDFSRELGARTVAVSWVEPDRRESKAAYQGMIAPLNRIADRCQEAGLRLVYHHHDFEFVVYDGQTALEMLCEAVGRDRMRIEADVHWIRRAGTDPVAYLKAMGPRCPLVHLKDLNPEGVHIVSHEDTLPFTEIGTGMLDFPAIVRAAEYAEWFIVEQDFCHRDPFESARISLDNLRSMGIGL